jgi:hypothetical protein
VLDGGAQAPLVGIDEPRRVLHGEGRHALWRRAAAALGDRTGDLEEHDRVRLDERAQSISDLGIAGGRHRAAVSTIDP